MQTGRRIAVELERTIYVIAGLPLALRGGANGRDPVMATLRRAFARRYWAPRNAREWLELVAGLTLAPVVVPLAALWFTLRNGPVIRRREGKGLMRQFLEQLRLYANAGIVGPW